MNIYKYKSKSLQDKYSKVAIIIGNVTVIQSIDYQI